MAAGSEFVDLAATKYCSWVPVVVWLGAVRSIPWRRVPTSSLFFPTRRMQRQVHAPIRMREVASRGFRWATTKEEKARAIMEGITPQMRDNVEAVRNMGISVEEIRAVGGATVAIPDVQGSKARRRVGPGSLQ